MGTYLNCYDLVEHVRTIIGEQSEQHLKGRNTTGKYSNKQIVQGINNAQRFIYEMLFMRYPQYFFETDSLTGVDSVYTLPSDFGQLLYFKDEDGRQVFPMKEKHRHLTESTGYDRLYTQRNNTFVLDKSGITETYILFYYRKPRDLDFGKASAGAATSITLATSAKKLADYYNGMTIENITQDWVDTIDDYSAARVATISETAVANDYYGIVSDLPEMFHHLLIPRAVMNLTGLYSGAKAPPSESGSVIFNDDLRSTMAAFSNRGLDKDQCELFDNWSPTARFPAGIIADD
jgi:hypothetical protein